MKIMENGLRISGEVEAEWKKALSEVKEFKPAQTSKLDAAAFNEVLIDEDFAISMYTKTGVKELWK